MIYAHGQTDDNRMLLKGQNTTKLVTKRYTDCRLDLNTALSDTGYTAINSDNSSSVRLKSGTYKKDEKHDGSSDE